MTKTKAKTQARVDAGAVKGRPGTKRYVDQGVRGVRVFMKKYADRLKATPIASRTT